MPRRAAPDRDELAQRILAVVDSIPRGRVATYGEVAREAGAPRHARLVGRLLAGLSPRSALPWQRVVGAGGRISPRAGDSGGAAERRQRGLLRREGVRFDERGRVDLARFGWAAGEASGAPPRPPGPG